MNIKYIIIILGEPYSIFSEILGKYFSTVKKNEKKIIIIGNINLLKKQLEKLNYKIKINKINKIHNANIEQINIININYKFQKVFAGISKKSNKYIEDSFKKFFEINKLLKDKLILINGPVSKQTFLKKKYLGITEYLSNKSNSKNEVMLIYNNKLSVSPLTTHIPLKYVAKKINKNKIIKNTLEINNFYIKFLKKKPKIAILGLNPHCETVDKFSEEEKIIKPAVKSLLSKNINIKGPFSADTFFLKKNIKSYDVVIGMYHDQVLTPIKTLYKFNAINITLGLPYVRISPDHGPNNSMIGMNISDPSSFFYAMRFIKKLK